MTQTAAFESLLNFVDEIAKKLEEEGKFSLSDSLKDAKRDFEKAETRKNLLKLCHKLLNNFLELEDTNDVLIERLIIATSEALGSNKPIVCYN